MAETEQVYLETRKFQDIGKDELSAEIRVTVAPHLDSGSYVIVDRTFKAGHYDYEGYFDWNEAMHIDPRLTVEQDLFPGRAALLRACVKYADDWFATCEKRIADWLPANQAAGQAAQ